MSEKPFVSIVIPTYNRTKILKLVLSSLDFQDYAKDNYEVIVVDDGSTDNTKQMIKDFQKEHSFMLKYHYQEKKGCRVAHARNLGASKASGSILIFINDDIVAPSSFISNHVNALKKHDIILGACCGYGSNQAYKLKEWEKNAYINQQCILKYEDLRDKVDEKRLQSYPWRYFVAANFSISKGLFDSFKFDEDFSGWGEEDTELGFRLHSSGKSIVYERSCYGYHILDDSEQLKGIYTPTKTKEGIKNMVLFYNKHPVREVQEYIIERYADIPLSHTSELIIKESYAFNRFNFIIMKSNKLYKKRACVIYPKFHGIGGAEKVLIKTILILNKLSHGVTLISENLPPPNLIKHIYDYNTEQTIASWIPLKADQLFPDLHAYFSKEKVESINQITTRSHFDIIFISQAIFPKINSKSPKIAIAWAPCPYEEYEASGYSHYQEYTFIANSEWTAQKLKNISKVDAQVIYPPSYIARDPPKMETKLNQVAVLTRFHHNKSPEFTMMIAQRFPEVTFHIIGLALTPSQRDFLISFSKQCGKNVHLHANLSLSDKNRLIQRCRFAIHSTGYEKPDNAPLLFEHFGISVAELMSYGCVMLHYKKGYFPEFVLDENQKFSTIEDCASKLKFFTQNERIAQETAMKNYQIAQRYSEEQFEVKMKELITKVCSHKIKDSSFSSYINSGYKKNINKTWDLHDLNTEDAIKQIAWQEECFGKLNEHKISFRRDGIENLNIRFWEYYWTISNTPAKPGSRILDVGCGGSIFPFLLAQQYRSRVIGVDCNPDETVRSMNQKRIFPELDVRFKTADISKQKLNEMFDAIFCISVIEHIKDYLAAIRNLSTHLRPGGYLSITFDFHPKLVSTSYGKLYNEDDVEDIVRFLAKQNVMLRRNPFFYQRNNIQMPASDKRIQYTVGSLFLSKTSHNKAQGVFLTYKDKNDFIIKYIIKNHKTKVSKEAE